MEILGNRCYDDATIGQVVAIIDGHDTRPEARSLEDMLVRDADKLWRFTPAGVGIAPASPKISVFPVRGL